MAMRVSGLNSGLDTDAIVQELVSAYSKKTEKYEKAQTKLSWKQETWKTLNSKIYGLYTKLSNLRFSSAYSTKKTTVSDNTKASISASGNAVNGKQTLNILSTAQSGYLTGSKIKAKEVDENTSLEDLGIGYGAFDIQVTTKDAEGTETVNRITVDSQKSVGHFVQQLKDVGLDAEFKDGRLQVRAGASGEEFKITTVSGGDDSDEFDAMAFRALNNLGLNTNYTTAIDSKALSLKYKPEAGGKTPENTTLEELGVKSEFAFKVKVKKQGTDDIVEKDITVNKGTTLAQLQKDLEAAGVKADFVDGRLALSAKDEGDQFSIMEDFDLEGVAEANHRLEDLGIRTGFTSGIESNTLINTKAQSSGVSGDTTLRQLGYNGSEVTLNLKSAGSDGAVKNTKIKINSSSSINDVVNQLKEAGINASYDENNGRIYLSSKTTGKDYDFELTAVGDANGNAGPAQEVLGMLGLDLNSGDAKKIDGSDAEIMLNGVTYTNNTNNFSINGLNIEAQAVTGPGEANAITINTSTDTQAIYDTIKDFLTEYNNIINEMTKLYNADSASDYEPLTDEEKDAMSDTEIEKWETKIKDSLLRRDTTLDSVMSTLINTMASAIEINGQKYSLSTFGIHTMGFLNAAKNEHNAFHIDGDADDENTSGNKEKLMKAITEDPDSVVEFMKQLTGNLYKALDAKMKSTSLSSAYKVYNDKEMDTQYANYTKTISQWEKKITQKEDYYYKKFTAMEKAMAKLQNQTSSLTGLFGG